MTEKPAEPMIAPPDLPELPPEDAAPDIDPNLEHVIAPERFKCARCGSGNLARGTVVDYSDHFEQVRFVPKRISLNWLNSLFNLRPWKALIKLDAVACRDCGAVTLEISPAELRRAERIREE